MVHQDEPIKIDIEDIENEAKEGASKAEQTTADISEELQRLGQQFADTMKSAWNSEERVRLEKEFREGMNKFAEELRKGVNTIKESQVADKVREQTVKIDSTDTAQKIKGSIAQGLKWLSGELANISDKMATADVPAPDAASDAEKAPPSDA